MQVPHDQLRQFIDQPLAPSAWLRVEQSMIDQFADATMDHQFIHVDAELAAQTPFGTTIAHGFLTLSLIAKFSHECSVRPLNPAMAINYGSDRVRYLQPVKAGSEIRAHARLLAVQEKAPGQILTKTRYEIEIKGEQEPAMVAELLSLFVLDG
jgi:acyl dehydratase